MVYGSVAFISNMEGGRSVSVQYAGLEYYLPNHTVAIVSSANGSARVLFNSTAA
jgi:hypothetical protein